MIQLSEEIAAKLSGKTEAELKTILFQEDGETLKDDAAKLFANTVTDKFKEVERDRAKNSYNKGFKEKAVLIEKALKPILQKYGVEASTLEESAVELADKLKNVKPGESGKPGKPQELTEDEIKKLPTYQTLLDKELEKVNAKASEWEQKYNTYVSDTERKAVFSTARDRALTLLDEKGAVWGADKVSQLDYFFKAIGTESLRLNEKGTPELVDADGNPLRDDSRNKIDFSDWVLSNWKKAGYTFHDAPPGSGSPGAGKPGEGGQGGSKIVINSPEQYESLLNKAKDAGERADIQAAFREHLKKNS